MQQCTAIEEKYLKEGENLKAPKKEPSKKKMEELEKAQKDAEVAMTKCVRSAKDSQKGFL